MEASVLDVCILGEGGSSQQCRHSGKGEGRALAVNCQLFQCGLCKREKGIYRQFHHYIPVLRYVFVLEFLTFHSFCSFLFVFQLKCPHRQEEGGY